jgi:predicted Zn-dependent protease
MVSLSTAGFLAGCATNPVTGESQLMLVSEDQEVQIDRQHSPHQYSSDYGIIQDGRLNNYVNQTGMRLARRSHRPHMPYAFQAVNATYVNAYAFPGGAIAVTRGILLKMKNEAELAALLGHELGHVNARHTARQMSKGMLTQAIVGGVAMAAGSQSETLGRLAGTLGMVSAGALLASYSRDNEREADALGMEYLSRAQYNSDGMVGLMEMLNNMSKGRHNAALTLFSTHPMGEERYRTAVNTARTKYRHTQNYPLHRQRYMDHTARLRRIKGAIKDMQNGEKALGEKKYGHAQTLFQNALRKAPRDYTGHLLMAKCLLIQEKHKAALRYTNRAKQIYPREAQANHLSGYANLKIERYRAAYQDFVSYDRKLSGNPNITFFKGYSLEGMQRIKEAANDYYRYLKVVNQGKKAQYAYGRLVEWGYIKK